MKYIFNSLRDSCLQLSLDYEVIKKMLIKARINDNVLSFNYNNYEIVTLIIRVRNSKTNNNTLLASGGNTKQHTTI